MGDIATIGGYWVSSPKIYPKLHQNTPKLTIVGHIWGVYGVF